MLVQDWAGTMTGQAPIMQRRSAASAAVAVAVVVVVAGVVALTANSPAMLQQLMPALDLSGEDGECLMRLRDVACCYFVSLAGAASC